MTKTGLFVGKFMPPHLGHKQAILDASKLCDQLIVLVCYEPNISANECAMYHLPPMPLDLKTQWIRQEFATYPNITVLSLDESGIPLFPNGWESWSNAVKNTVGKHIDIIFGSEISYSQDYATYFPDTIYHILDANRQKVNISSTRIRRDPKNHLNYIIPSAREYFEKFFQKK